MAALWNVHNLFDGRDDGTEYPEFRLDALWSAEKYQGRLSTLSQAVLSMLHSEGDPGPLSGSASRARVPDLLCFVELENLQVLEDLASGPLARYGYLWCAFAKLPGSALGVGFISRRPITDVRAHSITIGSETAPRPVLEVRLSPGTLPSGGGRGGPVREAPELVFLLSHWKSKVGGDDATEELRRASARLMGRRLGELTLSEPETAVIILGDFNLNYDDFYRRDRSVRYALLPDDPDAALMAGDGPRDFLVLSPDMPPQARHFPDDVIPLYSPWFYDLEGGSYFYRDDWETIDHFLLPGALFSGRGWTYAQAQVLRRPPFVNSQGVPESYVPRTGRGLSDHLPLLLYLQYEGGD